MTSQENKGSIASLQGRNSRAKAGMVPDLLTTQNVGIILQVFLDIRASYVKEPGEAKGRRDHASRSLSFTDNGSFLPRLSNSAEPAQQL